MNRKFLVIGLALAAVVLLFVFLSQTKNTTTVVHGTNEYKVLVADNPVEHARGLSGTKLESLGADGMLFVFDNYQERTFWMNGMNYGLDVIWIRDGKIMKIDQNIPAPAQDEEPARMYSRPFEVNYVLELPAGSADAAGMIEGHEITLKGYTDQE